MSAVTTIISENIIALRALPSILTQLDKNLNKIWSAVQSNENDCFPTSPDLLTKEKQKITKVLAELGVAKKQFTENSEVYFQTPRHGPDENYSVLRILYKDLNDFYSLANNYFRQLNNYLGAGGFLTNAKHYVKIENNYTGRITLPAPEFSEKEFFTRGNIILSNQAREFLLHALNIYSLHEVIFWEHREAFAQKERSWLVASPNNKHGRLLRDYKSYLKLHADEAQKISSENSAPAPELFYPYLALGLACNSAAELKRYIGCYSL